MPRGEKLETPVTPVGPDALDGGDVVEGNGGGGLATGSSSVAGFCYVTDFFE